jgi:hypothetical protein
LLSVYEEKSVEISPSKRHCQPRGIFFAGWIATGDALYADEVDERERYFIPF